MSHLNFELKNHFRLIAGDRWNVLTILLLHANIRNRCWVGMDRIAELATNGNIGHATKAKKWLVAHGAAELVDYVHRIGQEKELPARQHVYQLTGQFTTCNDLECCIQAGITVHYLYFQNPNVSDGENINVSDGEIFNGENLSNTNTRKTIKNKKDISPEEGDSGVGHSDTTKKKKIPNAPRQPNPIFDCIASNSFDIRQGTLANGAGGRIGKIIKWLKANHPDVTVANLEDFYRWYHQNNPKLNAPKADGTFAEYYTAWWQTQMTPAASAEKPIDDMTDAELLAKLGYVPDRTFKKGATS